MKKIPLSLLLAACFAAFAIQGQLVKAQPTPYGADMFHGIKDKPLHDALAKLQNVSEEPPLEVLLYGPSYMKKGIELSEYFSNPETSNAMLIVLNSVISSGLESIPREFQSTILGLIGAAVGSGRSEFTPILERLARDPNPKVRGAVANYDVNRYAPSNSLGVLKESILGAIEHLPREASGSEEFRARWDEFELAVGLYSEFATPSQRDEIRPLVEKTLKRYGLRFANFYRPRLNEALSAENRTIVKTMRGKDLVVEAKRNEAAIAAERNRKTVSEVLLWGSVILAPLGLIWLMIWKRRRRNRV